MSRGSKAVDNRIKPHLGHRRGDAEGVVEVAVVPDGVAKMFVLPGQIRVFGKNGGHRAKPPECFFDGIAMVMECVPVEGISAAGVDDALVEVVDEVPPIGPTEDDAVVGASEARP